jgi:hypothetical protein
MAFACSLEMATVIFLCFGKSLWMGNMTYMFHSNLR